MKQLALAAALALGLAAGFWAALRWDRRPERITAAFHKLYHQRGEQTYNRTFWLGQPVQKNPFDLWTFQEIIAETRPDVIVEAGTYKGGSAFYYASLCDLLGQGRVITIDIEDYPGKRAHPRISFVLGSSTAPETVARVRGQIKPGEKVMVILDSDHHKDHVLSELKLYSGLVTAGQYLVVEDTHFNGRPILPRHGPGPFEAVQEFLAADRNFVVDRERERFLMTFNPGGYLRRR